MSLKQGGEENLRLDRACWQATDALWKIAQDPSLDPGTSRDAARLVREVRKLKIRAWQREGWTVPAHVLAAETESA